MLRVRRGESLREFLRYFFLLQLEKETLTAAELRRKVAQASASNRTIRPYGAVLPAASEVRRVLADLESAGYVLQTEGGYRITPAGKQAKGEYERLRPAETMDSKEKAADYLISLMQPFKKGCTALDVGTGGGFLALKLCALGCKVTGLDPNPQALHEVKAVAGERCAAGGGVDVLQGLAADALALGKQYDYIVSSQAMHHIAPLGSTLKALYRLLKPGGALLVMDFEPGLASYWAHGFHPFAAPTREEWQQLLADSGFEPPHFRTFPPLVVLKAQKAAGE